MGYVRGWQPTETPATREFETGTVENSPATRGVGVQNTGGDADVKDNRQSPRHMSFSSKAR
jgi:hypothetical protein